MQKVEEGLHGKKGTSLVDLVKCLILAIENSLVYVEIILQKRDLTSQIPNWFKQCKISKAIIIFLSTGL